MNRSLRLTKVAPRELSALFEAGVHSVRDFYSVGALRLQQILPHLNANEVRSLVHTVSYAVAPRPLTALAMYSRWLRVNNSVPTGLKALDAALGGQGIPSDSVTELVGRAGVGKTQTCFTLAVMACLPLVVGVEDEVAGVGLSSDSPSADSSGASSDAAMIGTACYLDTERKFSAERVLQIAKARIEVMDPTLSAAAVKRIASSVVERIHVFTLCSCADVLSLLTDVQQLQAFIIENNAKIILVDSIAAVARQAFTGSTGLIKRQHWLNKVASQLKYLAETFHLPVLVTNQVTTGSSEYGGIGISGNTEVARGRSVIAPGANALASRTLHQQECVAGESQSSDARFRDHMASGLGGGSSHAPSLRPALGNTWAHGINTRLFLDVDAVAGSNHGTQRCIHITKSPTSPYLVIPFKLGSAGVMDLPASGEREGHP